MSKLFRFSRIKENGCQAKIVYFDQNVKQLHLHADYSKQMNEIISFRADADYFNWDVEVYYRPNFTANFSTVINLRDKIRADLSISYMGKRTVNNTVSDLQEQIHVNLGLHYSYSKQVSAYLQLNNLTNSRQDLWFGYQELAFNGLFGINFSF